MEIIKKITIIAVLIASLILIINFLPPTLVGIQTNIQERQQARQDQKIQQELEAERQAESDAILTAEEKCEEAREKIVNFQVEASDLKIDIPEAEWVDQYISEMNEILISTEKLVCSGCNHIIVDNIKLKALACDN